MMMAIQGIGVLGGFGCGIDSLETALRAGQVETGKKMIKTADGPKPIPVFLANTDRLEEFVNKRALRRVDQYSKMALLGAHLALQDAGRLDEDRSRMGIIIATGYGASNTTFAFLDSFIEGGDSLSSPTFFSNSVHNAAVANISMLLGITGPGLTVSQFEMSVPSALFVAQNWLDEGRVDSVLFGALDEYCDVLGYCIHNFFGPGIFGLTGIDPFNLELQTAIPGEGAAFLLLTKINGASTPYGVIKDVVMGRNDGGITRNGEPAMFILGSDGSKGCGGHYKRYLSQGVPLASYTPYYGSIPVSPAFDMAIASLILKQGTAFASPAGSSRDKGTHHRP